MFHYDQTYAELGNRSPHGIIGLLLDSSLMRVYKNSKYLYLIREQMRQCTSSLIMILIFTSGLLPLSLDLVCWM
jgi:hypothetical protein